MNTRFICILICLTIVFVIPTLVISIASFIIGANNINTDCDGKDIIRLSTWLFVNSTIALISIILYILLLILFFYKEQYKILVITVFIYIINCIFVIIWNIIGCIELFKHATECKSQAENLWIIVLVSLIFQWMNLTFAFLMVRYDCGNIIGIDDNEDNLANNFRYYDYDNYDARIEN